MGVYKILKYYDNSKTSMSLSNLIINLLALN